MRKKYNLTSKYYFHVLYQNYQNPLWPEIVTTEDGSIITKKSSKFLDEYTFFDYIDDYYRDTILMDEVLPYFICTGEGSLRQLDNMCLQKSQVDYLNQKGLKIFLFENILYDIKKNKSEKYYMSQPSIYPEKHFLQYENLIRGIENTEDNLENMWSYELESIDNFVVKNNLTCVIVCCCDYNISEYFQKKYKNFVLRTDDIYAKSLLKETNSTVFDQNEYPVNQVIPSTDKIKYKFICLNSRFMGTRNIIASSLLNKSCILSYNGKIIPYNYSIDKFLWFDIERWSNTNPNIYYNITRNRKLLENKTISIEEGYTEAWAQGQVSIVPRDMYYQCGCSIVNESRFAVPTAMFSEKTFNAIKCFRPFILTAPPKSLEALKIYGIKTFSDYWDESYDNEFNNEKRLIKIIELINDLDKMTLDDFKKMYSEMRSILQHNYNILKEIKNFQMPLS